MPALFALLFLLTACAGPEPPAISRAASAPSLEEAWRVTGLAAPESAALSADGAFVYVTNVNGEGEARDGNGFIARVSLDGRVIEREWARGFDAPKGVARAGDRLYVSDIDRLVVVDAASGDVLERHAVAGASFLNDVAIAPDGGVLISDSANARIYRFAGGRIETWLEAPLLDSINGLLPEADRLIVTTMAGRLVAVDWSTRAITQLADGLGDGDGVAALGAGAYLVSEWPGRLFHVNGEGVVTGLIDTRAAQAYMNDFLLVDDLLIVPNWRPGSVTAYRVRRDLSRARPPVTPSFTVAPRGGPEPTLGLVRVRPAGNERASSPAPSLACADMQHFLFQPPCSEMGARGASPRR